MGIVWRPAMSTGLAWQDEQHKEMLRQIDVLLEAIERNEGASVVKEMLDFLVHYTDKHFRDEETYMRETACSTCELHVECHRIMREHLAEINATYNRHGASTMVVLKLQTLFRDWLINHILLLDKKMVEESVPEPIEINENKAD